MLQKPTSGAEVDFDDWAILDVEAVVVGRVRQTADNAYSVQFQLFDVYGRKQLVYAPEEEFALRALRSKGDRTEESP